MRVLFCDSVIDRKMVEPMYEAEYRAAQTHGMSVSLISHEALVDEGNIKKALSLVKPAMEREMGIYRGWMMRPEEYAMLYEGLLQKQIQLINSPEEYSHCHLFPESYGIIASHTPKSVVIPEAEMDNDTLVQAALNQLNGSAIVKDYVKSLKHYWEEACFIPDSSDWESAQRIIHRFIELQGSSQVGGLVLREFVRLKKIAEHSKSGMPLAEEYRIFFWKGEVHQIIPYWEEGEYTGTITIPEAILAIGKQIQSHFFTMDLARMSTDRLIIMELGDGQVAGLPDQTDIEAFYRNLSA